MIEIRVGELVVRKGVKFYGIKLVGFILDEVYRRIVKVLFEGNVFVWKYFIEYRMWVKI